MEIDLKKIKKYALNVRTAFETAKARGCLNNNEWLKSFPHASCLVSTEILAEYLSRQGVKTIIVHGSGSFQDGTHAWLIINDRSIKPERIKERLPVEIAKIMHSYGGNTSVLTHDEYDIETIWSMNVVDITIDQFGAQYTAPYVGKALELHNKFSNHIELEVYTGKYDRHVYNIISNWL